MDPVNTNNETLAPVSSRTPILFVWLIIGLQILVSLISYPFLPARVPSHWNAAGEIDSHMHKLLSAIIFPVLSIGLYMLIRVLLAASPKLGRDNQQAAISFTLRLLPAVFLLLLGVQLATIVAALGKPVDISFMVTLLVSLLFVYLGNYLGKLRRNFWGGVRTPWTLASDTVWERTHRLGGWLFVAVGLIGIVASFVSPLRLWIIIGGLLLITVILYGYSYLVYRRVATDDGEDRVSPPFNN